MKNQILYIALYENDTSSTIGLSYQFINQNTTIDKLINIFINTHDLELTHVYKYYFNNDKVEFIIENDDSKKLKDILNNNIKNFSHVVLLNNKFLYNKNFNNDILVAISSNIDTLIDSNKKDKGLSIFRMSDVCDTSLKDLLSKQPKIDSNSMISSNINFIKYVPETILYSDNSCLFCQLSHRTDSLSYLNSYVYINKKNNKVYNIANNILGNLVYIINDRSLSINWLINNSTIPIFYKKEYGSDRYIDMVHI